MKGESSLLLVFPSMAAAGVSVVTPYGDISSGFQVPHVGKYLGIGGKSVCSPTLNIKPIPTSM